MLIVRRLVRRSLLALILAAGAAGPAIAQPPFPRQSPRPNAWASLSVGLYNLQEIFDPESNSVWDFGNIFQFRGSLEREFQRGTTIGVAATLARAPLTYDGPECVCDADLTLWQALALFRLGGGRSFGLHQVIEIAAGVSGFSNFSARTGSSIGPGTTIDPTFKIGYGLGYPLGPNLEFNLVQEVGLMLHERGERAAGDESNVPRTWSTRVGIRYGLGTRR
jgi:hypothetical protein